MRIWAGLLLSLLLCACASAPPAGLRSDDLFHDEWFGPPTDRVGAQDIFALNDAMRDFLSTDIARELRTQGAQRGLIDALYRRGQLRLEYDSGSTRTASQAFDARAGNCLSLVLMTAAFAKELGLPIEYQSAFTEETWSRNGNILFRSGHVNVTLGHRLVDLATGRESSPLTIDFLSAEDVRSLRTHVIDENTVMSMYMNNRAAEALVKGELDNAYAWARESIRRSPGFMSAFNTLAVIYTHHHDLAAAEQVLARLLDHDPSNTRALSNLAAVMEKQGRVAESNALMRRIEQLEPNPPFRFFDLGMAAMKKEDYRLARDFFAKEVARAEYYHEFQFWLGLAHYKLGDMAEASRHLALAMEHSTTRGDRDLYAAKLAWLRSHRQQ